MRRLLIVLVLVVLLTGGVAAYLLTRPPSGPFPSAGHLRMHGFAAWPADTVEEARRECAEADGWRLDERATAVRFAREVLRYPDPSTSDWSDDKEHQARFLVTSDGVPGVFLGSLLVVTRYGHCWYVTEGFPREGDLGATLGFVYRDGDAHLLLSNPPEVPTGYVGFGEWETAIDPGLRQTIVAMPPLDPTATGHAIYTQPDKGGVSEVVGVETLGAVPPPPQGAPAEPIDPAAVADEPGDCRGAQGFKTPERAIRHLYEWEFDYLLQQVGGYRRFQRKSWRHLDGDRWRVVVDDAVLVATIPRVSGRCYSVLALEPVGRDSPLRRLWIDETAVTFGIDWGGGDEALISYGSGLGFAKTLKELGEPVTFPQEPVDGPAFAGVVLYKDGHVVSAYYAPFSD